MATGGSLSRSVQEGSEEMFDYICSSCESRNDKIVEATYYCIECGDFYCVICLDFHKGFPGLKNHTVLGRREVKKWGQHRNKSVPTDQCLRHSGKVLEMYCSNHDVLCCHVCVSLEHRLCKGMEYIPELAKGINHSSEIKKVHHNLDRVKSEMEKLKTTRKRNKASMDKSRNDVLERIKDFRTQANKVFDTLEKEATHDMENSHQDNTINIQADVKTCDDYLDELQQVKQKLQTTSRDNESQLFIQVKKCQQQIQEGDQMIQMKSATTATNSFKFNINSELKRYLTNIQSLGKIEIKTNSPNIHVQKQKKKQHYKMQNRSKHNVKLKGDKLECYITGCCQMPDGTILLADNNNSKLKQLNSSYQVTNHCNLSGPPQAVCCISPQEAAVSDDNRTIHFLSVGKTKMAETRSIEMNHKCWGLAYNFGHLLVSDGNKKVHFYDTSGTCLRTIYKDKNGTEIFSSTRHIAVSADGSKIYVADNNIGLVTLTSGGQLLSSFQDKDLDNASGVCVNGQGSVLVSNFNPPTVIQLDEKGIGKLQVTSIGKDSNVKSICVDRNNATLLVTTINVEFLQSVDDNSVTIYDLT